PHTTGHTRVHSRTPSLWIREMLHTANTCTAAATSRYRHASHNTRPHVYVPENGGSQTSATTMLVRIKLPISGHVTGVKLCGEDSLVSTACLRTTHYVPESFHTSLPNARHSPRPTRL